MTDYLKRIEQALAAEVDERVGAALDSLLAEGAGRSATYARVKAALGERVGDVLAELYAEAVAAGDARPTISGRALAVERFADFATLDLRGAGSLRLHDPRLAQTQLTPAPPA